MPKVGDGQPCATPARLRLKCAGPVPGQVDPLVAAFASRIDLEKSDMNALMLASHSTGVLDGGSVLSPAASRAAACNWLRASSSRWAPWIPAICEAGTFVNDELSRY